MTRARKGIWKQFISCIQTDYDERQYTVYCRLCKDLNAQNCIGQVPQPQRWNAARDTSRNTTRFNNHCRRYHSTNLEVIAAYNLRELTKNERELRFQQHISLTHPVIERINFPQNAATKQAFIRSVIQFN